MLAFNADQLVTIFASAPFLIQWLFSKEGYYQVFGYVALTGYIVLYVWLICLVFQSLENEVTR